MVFPISFCWIPRSAWAALASSNHRTPLCIFMFICVLIYQVKQYLIKWTVPVSDKKLSDDGPYNIIRPWRKKSKKKIAQLNVDDGFKHVWSSLVLFTRCTNCWRTQVFEYKAHEHVVSWREVGTGARPPIPFAQRLRPKTAQTPSATVICHFRFSIPPSFVSFSETNENVCRRPLSQGRMTAWVQSGLGKLNPSWWPG
jgi:hypothetical protein